MKMNLGALPPKKDLRDYKLTKGELKEEFPESYSCFTTSTIKNQGTVCSCVAHATSSILESYIGFQDTLSTNFIYGIQNKECGHDGYGMYLRDACSIVKKYGDMLEQDCEGNYEVPECWDIAECALNEEYKAKRALNYKIESYVSLQSESEIKKFLMSYGPALGSIKWYNNFKLSNKNILEGTKTGSYGYHAIAVIGWNKEGFICQNSYGDNWGDKGYFTLPYSIGIEECFGLIDDSTLGNDIKKPKRNKLLDILYKIVNWIINLFHR